jgi:hypothetical protein
MQSENCYILVSIDCFTRFVELRPVEGAVLAPAGKLMVKRRLLKIAFAIHSFSGFASSKTPISEIPNMSRQLNPKGVCLTLWVAVG